MKDHIDQLIEKIQRLEPMTCPTCGIVFEGNFLSRWCEPCIMDQRAKDAFQSVMRELGDTWPTRHRQTLDQMTGPGLEKAQDILKLVDTGAMIVLAGDRGRGKTQMATWLAWQRGKSGKRPGIYAKAFDLFSAIKATWSKNSQQGENDAIARYKRAAFLALDECHERGETDWENRTLRNVLDHRYDACLPTVLIGNWRTGEEISASLGASITDRITETGGIVWCKWESYRTP